MGEDRKIEHHPSAVYLTHLSDWRISSSSKYTFFSSSNSSLATLHRFEDGLNTMNY